MGACRCTHSLWCYIKKVIRPYGAHYGRWKCFKDLMKLPINTKYFWHDSFGKYFNRFLLCPLLGHKNVHWLIDGGCGGERPMHHCFCCEQEVDPGIDKIMGEIK